MKNSSFAKRKIAAIALTLMLGVSSLSTNAFAANTKISSNAANITFSSSSITADKSNSDGYSISGTDLTISKSGTYTVSGSCKYGSITVKEGTKDVTIVLNGLNLTSSDSAPIQCDKSTTVTILAASGSENKLADTELNNKTNHSDNTEAENAVIKCKDGSQVVIGGTGTIDITAKGKAGIKSGATTDTAGTASLTIKDVNLNIDAADDAINAEATLNVTSGKLELTAVDDAIHSDYTLNIGTAGSSSGPVINVKSSAEGLEAATLNVNSGNITIKSTDDGLNAANSSLTNYNFDLNIAGGTLYVDAGGDCIDSNGTLDISGGNITLYSASTGDTSLLDSDNGITVTGGTLIGIGAAGMIEEPASSSTQSFVSFGQSGSTGGMQGSNNSSNLTIGTQNFNSSSSVNISAGDTVSITDANGKSLVSAKALHNASYVIYSSASLTKGSSYNLNINGTKTAASTAATQGTSMMGGGNPPSAPNGNFNPPSGTQNNGTMPPYVQQNGSSAYTDVANSAWYSKAVEYVTSNKIMTGTSDSTFEPSSKTTRAMVATILYRMAGSPATSTTSEFTDVSSSSWYASAVAWCKANDIYEGMPDGTFRPNETITREQLATVLQRFAEYSKQTTDSSSKLSSFKDASSVSPWAKDAISWATGNNILTGYSDNTLQPKNTTTRAELAQILYNYFLKIGSNSARSAA